MSKFTLQLNQSYYGLQISQIMTKDVYSKPCQTSKMEYWTKTLMAFSHWLFSQKKSMLDVWQGFKYAPGLLKLLCCGSKNDTQEGWYLPNWL